MKKFITLVFPFALLLNVSGCGNSPGEAEMKEIIVLMNDTADAIDKKDEAKRKQYEERAAALKKKLDDKKLPEEEKKKLEAKYQADVEKAAKRVAEANEKASKG